MHVLVNVLTKTPFIIVYQAYDYIDMIISCKALQLCSPLRKIIEKPTFEAAVTHCQVFAVETN